MNGGNHTLLGIAILLLAAAFGAAAFLFSPFSGGVERNSGEEASMNPCARGPLPLELPTRTRGCVSKDGLPDAGCTPGGIFSAASVECVCRQGYTKNLKTVSDAAVKEVLEAYGVENCPEGNCEVDHLVPLELGGSNDPANLWPQPADPVPGFSEKNRLEERLRQQVCDGKIGLGQAQKMIAKDWVAAYSSQMR